ncbi:MAG: VOC family protein, partial [Thermomicrobiales bacterium]
MPLKNLGAITMFIDDLERSKAFYQGAFDLKVVFEDDNAVVFDFGNTVLNMLK